MGWSGWAGWAGLAGLAGLPGPTSKIINSLGSERALEQKERELFRNIKKVLFRTLLMFLKKVTLMFKTNVLRTPTIVLSNIKQCSKNINYEHVQTCS